MGSKVEYEANKARKWAMNNEMSERQKRDEKLEKQMFECVDILHGFLTGTHHLLLQPAPSGSYTVSVKRSI